jgi:hypothetical protein
MVGMLNPGAGAGTTTSATVPNRTNGMAADAPAPGAENGAGAGQGATPEQMKQVNLFINNAYKIIYSDEMLPRVEEGLKGAGDPVSGLSEIAALIILRVARDAFENGIKDPGVLVAGGAAVIDDLAELSERLGVHQYSQDEITAIRDQVVEKIETARNADKGRAAPAGQPPAGQPAPAGPPAQGMMPPNGMQG